MISITKPVSVNAALAAFSVTEFLRGVLAFICQLTIHIQNEMCSLVLHKQIFQWLLMFPYSKYSIHAIPCRVGNNHQTWIHSGIFCIPLESLCYASLWQVTSTLLVALFHAKLPYLVGELEVACGYF